MQVYLAVFLTITKSALEHHLSKLRRVLIKLRNTKLKVNAGKSFFCIEEVKYLGHLLTCKGIEYMPKKVLTNLALKPPTSIEQLHRFLGMIQYYRDLQGKCSQLLEPLTDLVSDCGHTKVARAKNTKKKPWH